jgi:hypothetical protein
MYNKYRTVILVLSILLLLYALHLLPTSSIHNVSALLTDPYVGVFWDRNCTQGVSSIDWGTLAPGMTKTVSVYVQSKSNETCILILIPTGWNPPVAANYLELSQDYENKKIQPSEVVKVTLSLAVSASVAGVTNFSFNVIVEGSEYLLGDINQDGKVDGKDLSIASKAFASYPEDPRWDPRADLNRDGRIDGKDIAKIAANFGTYLFNVIH